MAIQLVKQKLREDPPKDDYSLLSVLRHVTTNGDIWKHDRKVLNPAFHKMFLTATFPVMTKHCQTLIDQLLCLGPVKYILGIEVERDIKNKRTFVHQTKYIKTILQRFNMLDSKPMDTPMTGKFLQKRSENEPALDPKVPYRSVRLLK